MTSGTPTSQPEDQARTGAAPSVLVSWRRRWLEPVVVATIVIALVSTLIMGWMTMFQSLKEDIHSSEARLMEAVKLAEIRNDTRIHEVKMELKEAIVDFKAENVLLKAELKADNESLRKEFKAENASLRAEFKAELRAALEANNEVLRKEFKAESASLRAEFKEDIADLREEIKGDLAELKEDVRAMGDKLDRVLETLLAAKI